MRFANLAPQTRPFSKSTPRRPDWVELLLSMLECPPRGRGEFGSIDDGAERIIAFFTDYNRRAAPFRSPMRTAHS